MKSKPIVIAFFMISLMSTFQSQAAPITASYSFEAADFGGFAPQQIVAGSFTTTFVPLESGVNGYNQASLDAIDLTINGFQYTRDNSEIIVQNGRISTQYQYTGKFFLGGTINCGALCGITNSDDFRLQFIDFAPDDFGSVAFEYWVVGSDSVFKAGNVNISRMESVPVPSAVWMMLSGCAVLVAIRRNR